MNSVKKVAKRALGSLFSPNSFLYEHYHLCRGVIAACLNNFPTRRMIVIGVTGTNGKTTTANLIAAILKAAGHKVGLSTTVNFWIGDQETTNETKMTTDNPFALHRRLAAMVRAGCQYAVIETASHALAQHRTWGISYDIAVFTNLTWDHLDYHKTFESYRDAKLKLFRQTYSSAPKSGVPKLAIINFDDPSAPYFTDAFGGNKLYYTLQQTNGSTTKESLVSATIKSATLAGTQMIVHTPLGSQEMTLHLPGNFNVQNALAAIATTMSLGVSLANIKAGLEQVSQVAGRMERIVAGQPFEVIVDYAHTPDGFTQALSTLRTNTTGKLIVIFGAAGNRDKAKRPLLGQIAAQYADTIILTEEDPDTEDPIAIMATIRQGIPPTFDSRQILEIPVRTEAIAKAISLAKPADTVVALAMGAQTVMATSRGMVRYNERKFIHDMLKQTYS